MAEADGGRGARTSRRSFLKALGGAAGLAALPLPARGSSGRQAPAERYDVIVVGGGFAGVTAARELTQRGFRTLIVEARHRLGGRTFTAQVGDAHVDLGGTWIHWTQPFVWAEAMRYGLPLVETPGALPERVLWWDGSAVKEAGLGEALALAGAALCASGETPDAPLRTLEALALAGSLASEFHAPALRAFPRPFDPLAADTWKPFDALSVRDRLDAMDLSADRRGLLEGLLGSACCGPFAEAGFVEMLRWWALSGGDFQRYGDSVARYSLRDGTVSLLEAILADGRPDVRLGTPVAGISQGPDGVRVTSTAGEEFLGRAAIAALPLNLLGSIAFTPALHPEKRAASRERHSGAGIKLYARVRGDVPRLAAFAPESEPLSMIFTAESGEEGGTLIAFGTDPRQIDAHSTTEVQAALTRFLPGVTVRDSWAHDWHLDPYALGTWCILRPGQMTRYLARLREPEGLVHFAGGDIALGWRGFIDGAIESGSCAAKAVAEMLTPGASAVASPTQPGIPLPQGASGPMDEALRPCALCHPMDASGAHGIGPNLHGVAGRSVADAPGYGYSDALRARKGRWTPAELDAFLESPARHVPGTTMPFGGVKDPRERAEMIEALSKLRGTSR